MIMIIIVDDDDHDHDHDQDDDIKSQEPEAPSLADGASNTYCPPSPSVRDYERMLAATSSFNVGGCIVIDSLN